MTDFRYTAYLSYSHKDSRWADWLHRALERYRIPGRLRGADDAVLPKTLAPVFRDRDDLSSVSDLSEILSEALAQSGHLIVLCSPSAAASRWVNEEIRSFRALGREDRILCVVVEGDPQAPLGEGGCFPPALFEGGAGREPLAADPRDYADGKRLALLKIVAGLLSVPLDALRRRDLSRRRSLRAVAALAAVGVLFLAGLAVSARIAEQQERAQAEQMATFIVDLGEELEGDLDLQSLGRMSATAIRYLDQIDADRLSAASKVKVAKALIQLGYVNWHQGAISDAGEAFERARVMLDELTRTGFEADPETVDEVWFELSQAEFYVGYLLVEIGEEQDSRPYLERYLEIAEARLEARPGDPRWLLEVAYANSGLINAGLNIEESVDADVVAAVDRNIELAKRAVEANVGDAEAMAHYGNELAFASDARFSICDLDRALTARKESLEVFEQLYEASGQSGEFEIDLALRHKGLGNVLLARGQLEDAMVHQQAAMETFRNIFSRDPSNETNIADLASTHHRVGQLLMFGGDLAGAGQHFSEARALFEPLVADEEVFEWHVDDFRFLVLEEVMLARFMGDTQRALQLLDSQRSLLTSPEAAEDISVGQGAARQAYRYERWRLTGVDPAASNSSLFHQLPADQGDYMGCSEAELLARHLVIVGNLPMAQQKTKYLEDAGYEDPGFVDFCQHAGICGP